MATAKPKYYITTPIYYVNARPHLGHTYTTIAADALARYKQMRGFDVLFLTGTDEHGQKVERSAKKNDESPIDFVDRVSAEYRDLWKQLGLRVDRFIRTTETRHAHAVQHLFREIQNNGYVYKGHYEGNYCVSDEMYIEDSTPGATCPECGRVTERVKEENYFFQLSKFEKPLLNYYEQHPEFIQPEARRNEVISFVRGGLRDLSISRTTLKWGIPWQGKHVAYVWFDALIGYISAVKGTSLWPADLHLIGKEILRFHAVFWPAFLMGADLPLPKKIFAHGWLLFEESKMSKSRGNIVRAEPIRQVMGADALRYFLFRETVFGQDGSFSYDALIGRYNSELANGLGNLVSRTLTMINQYRGGAIPAGTVEAIADAARATIGAVAAAFDALEFTRGLEAIWVLLSKLDKFIVERAPWKMARLPEAQADLDATLYTAAEALRIATVLLAPVLPESTLKIWAQLGMAEPVESVRLDTLAWGQLPAGQKI